MTQTGSEPGQRVSLGGKAFDPLAEQQSQERNSNNLPDDPTLVAAWILQFTRPLTNAEKDEFRTRHGLALTEYLPPRSYVERLSGRQMQLVGADARVRAAMRFLGDFKLAVSARALLEGRRTHAEGPVLMNAIVFPDADVEAVIEGITNSGAGSVQLIDDRAAGGGVVVRFQLLPETDLLLLSELEAVRWVEPVPVDVDDDDRSGTGRVGEVARPGKALDALHGEGQVIGLIDRGQPDLKHCFFADPANPDPGPDHRKIRLVRNSLQTPPSDHATFTAGIAVGDDLNLPGVSPHRGVAWAATLVCGNRLDLADVSSLFAELDAAGQAGARIHSNSWHSRAQLQGDQPSYDSRTAEADNFVWLNEDHLVVGSSGNTGEEQGPPGTSKNGICVSCASPDPAAPAAGDGNPGPTVDGRRKPDLVASGCQIVSAQRKVVEGVRCSTGVMAPCASSFATPRVAALGAIARQYFTEGFHPTGQPQASDRINPSAALLKAVLIHAAVRPDPAREYPNQIEGWGFLDSLDILLPTPDGQRALLWDVRNTDGLATGDNHVHELELTNGTPLKITLVWTDPPGSIGSDRALVNDLDLVVSSPTGRTYLGNVFERGASVEGGLPDRVDNVETVVLPAPEPGRWLVEVRAHEVNVGAQGYALLVTGSLESSA